MSCSCALRSGNAPMKPLNRPTRFSAPSTEPRVPPCHLTSGVTYSDARSGSCPLNTRRVYSRTISTFASTVVVLAIVCSFHLRLRSIEELELAGREEPERLVEADVVDGVPVLSGEAVFDA